MATSSIFANFDITDKKAAEAFVSALDASAHDPKREPVAPVKPPLTDHVAIKAFLAKRKQNSGTNINTDLIKHIMLKPIRLSAKCYDKHFAFLTRSSFFG